MILQILVPQYKETENIIKPLLDSIEIQQNIDLKNDVGVIIVNDGTEVRLSKEFLSNYSYEIKYYQHKHKGVSATRNACLDYATADYVMFCDADDMFFNICGLYLIINEIKNGGFDSLVSSFIEETRHPETNEPLYITREIDSTFVHGKVHNRKYLLDTNIRWNDELTIHEDSYFNCLCQNLSQNVKYCPNSFYLWKWREDSVCRHDQDYILKTFNNMLDSNTALVKQFLIRGRRDLAKHFVTMMIYDSYFTLNKEEWINQQNKDYRMAVELRFKKYWKDFKHLHDEISEEEKNRIIMGIKNKMFSEGLILESITFAEWIKIIENLTAE